MISELNNNVTYETASVDHVGEPGVTLLSGEPFLGPKNLTDGLDP